MIDWTLKTFEAMDLPPKILLAGQSIGCWIISIYASFCPDRVEALFLASPGGTRPYDPETYDIYKMRNMRDLSKPGLTQKEVEEIEYEYENKIHFSAKL